VSVLAAIGQNVGLIIMPKAAMTTILRVLAGKYRAVTAEEFRLLPTRFAFWREPHDRMESTWRQRVTDEGFDHFRLPPFTRLGRLPLFADRTA
jgi:hypothetical protein